MSFAGEVQLSARRRASWTRKRRKTARQAARKNATARLASVAPDTWRLRSEIAGFIAYVRASLLALLSRYRGVRARPLCQLAASPSAGGETAPWHGQSPTPYVTRPRPVGL